MMWQNDMYIIKIKKTQQYTEQNNLQAHMLLKIKDKGEPPSGKNDQYIQVYMVPFKTRSEGGADIA